MPTRESDHPIEMSYLLSGAAGLPTPTRCHSHRLDRSCSRFWLDQVKMTKDLFWNGMTQVVCRCGDLIRERNVGSRDRSRHECRALISLCTCEFRGFVIEQRDANILVRHLGFGHNGFCCWLESRMRWLVGDVTSSCMSEPCSSNPRPQVEDGEREKPPPKRKEKKEEGRKRKGKERKEEYSLAVLFTMVPRRDALSSLSIVVVLVDDPGASGKENR